MSVECFKTGHNLSQSLHFIAYVTPNLPTLHSLPVNMYYVGQGSVHTLGVKLQAESDNLSSSIGRFELHLTHTKRLCGVVNGDEATLFIFLELSQLCLDIINNCSGIWLLKQLQSVIQDVWSSERSTEILVQIYRTTWCHIPETLICLQLCYYTPAATVNLWSSTRAQLTSRSVTGCCLWNPKPLPVS